MQFDQKLKSLLDEASLYGLMAKRYEYSDPQRHMYFYQKHFQAVMKLEQHYMMMESHNNSSHNHSHHQAGNFPMY
ncbi:hypothetical protein ACFOGI_15155 [Virgibacillus xinjiangensis]|uniref:Uncharacterized protein n=1 Tax=Virgibacillus xinjiangensis TaxID=393090 RepID=A0ABV7CZP9_9BACI